MFSKISQSTRSLAFFLHTASNFQHCPSAVAIELGRSDITHQNSPSLRTRTLSNSLSLCDSPSHSQLLSLQGPVHSPSPHGFLSLTSGVSPSGPRTRAKPVTLYACCVIRPLRSLNCLLLFSFWKVKPK